MPVASTSGVWFLETMNPLVQLTQWLGEEQLAGNPFAHGAVLGTVGRDGAPRTRMLGVHFDEAGIPRFHTSPTSRKVADIALDRRASITFAFQRSLRSVSLEGILELIPDGQLMQDWLALEPEFRRSYLVFGHCSGRPADSDALLERQLKELPLHAENEMPPSFIGYRFLHVNRVAFYSVGSGNFAEHVVFVRNELGGGWCFSRVVP